MSNVPDLFREDTAQEPPRPSYLSAGTLFLVVYVSERDTHITSIHQTMEPAKTAADDHALHMRRHRQKFFAMGQTPECYLVVECPVVHVSRI